MELMSGWYCVWGGVVGIWDRGVVVETGFTFESWLVCEGSNVGFWRLMVCGYFIRGI